jgi:hypothetical protein
VLPHWVRKSGEMVRYYRVGRGLFRKRLGKLIRQGKRSVKAKLTRSDTAQVATRVRWRVTHLGINQVSDSCKVPGSDSGKESGTLSDKGPGKNSDKEVGQDIMCKTRRFLCFGVNPS